MIIIMSYQFRIFLDTMQMSSYLHLFFPKLDCFAGEGTISTTLFEFLLWGGGIIKISKAHFGGKDIFIFVLCQLFQISR